MCLRDCALLNPSPGAFAPPSSQRGGPAYSGHIACGKTGVRLAQHFAETRQARPCEWGRYSDNVRRVREAYDRLPQYPAAPNALGAGSTTPIPP